MTRTFDQRVQRAAERALKRIFDEKVAKGSKAEAAVVVMSPDGAVRAMIGGGSYADSQFNRAVDAKRQAGSAFKPFVYLAAVEAGYTPTTPVVDQPVTIGGWSPRNSSRRIAAAICLS